MKKYLILSIALVAMAFTAEAQRRGNYSALVSSEVYVSGHDGTGNSFSGGYSTTNTGRNVPAGHYHSEHHVHTDACDRGCSRIQTRTISRSCDSPGFINRVVQERVWVPGHYTYRRGCRIFIDGYWDWVDIRIDRVRNSSFRRGYYNRGRGHYRNSRGSCGW